MDRKFDPYRWRSIDPADIAEDFRDVIRRQLSEVDTVIVVIGPDWLTVEDAVGNSRIDDPEDLVRLEITAALLSPAAVVPVLVDGASMPSAEELPTELSLLSFTNALEVHSGRFSEDMDRLLKAADPDSRLRRGSSNISPARKRVGTTIAVIGGLMLVVAFPTFFVGGFLIETEGTGMPVGVAIGFGLFFFGAVMVGVGSAIAGRTADTSGS